MARAKWFFDRMVDIVVDVIAGILIYLIVGGYVTQPLTQVSPYLPTLLILSLVLAILAGLLYRSIKSIMFHRFIESNYGELIDFLNNWDNLNNACVVAINEQRNAQRITEFENIRTKLAYNYPKIAKAVRTQRYSRIDRLQGVAVHNYDVIGNLLATSPFTRMQFFNQDYAYRDFKENWDIGRTILVSTIGLFDCIRSSFLHLIYLNLRLVSFAKKREESEG